MLVFIADIVPQIGAGPDVDSRFILPPQTPVLVEAAAPAHSKPHIQRQQHEHIMRSATVKPLSIRDAAARAIEKYLEKVLLCVQPRLSSDSARQVFPSKPRNDADVWDVEASTRIRQNAEKWASAQVLITRIRKVVFSVAWDALQREVKEGRYVGSMPCLVHAFT